MLHKKDIKTSDNGTLSSVEKEMGKPRMARSAQVAQRKFDPARIAERPSTTVPGTVDRIIPSRRSGEPGTAQIALKGTSRPHRELRIVNVLTDENGEDFRLEKGARVDVTIEAALNISTAKPKTDH